MLLKDARTPYEVTAPFSRDFEEQIQEKHASVRFIRFSENVEFRVVRSRSPVFEIVSARNLLNSLRGDEVILIFTMRRDNGVARIYAVHDELPTLIAYEEFTPMSEGTGLIKMVSHEKVVFAKNILHSPFVTLFLVNGMGTVWVWFVGLMIWSEVAKKPRP